MTIWIYRRFCAGTGDWCSNAPVAVHFRTVEDLLRRFGQAARREFVRGFLPIARVVGDLTTTQADERVGMRTACFSDPDGHVWEVAQELGGGG